jgi:predicted nucleic acid-binding protein
MNIYAESSAVLAWLLGESGGAAVASELEKAGAIVVSDITLVECDRVLHRSVATGILREAQALGARALLNRESVHWERLTLGPEVVERARRPFPEEPVRTLDALHLASALRVRAALPDLAVLSLDHRVRTNALALGLDVIPG